MQKTLQSELSETILEACKVESKNNIQPIKSTSEIDPHPTLFINSNSLHQIQIFH